MDSPKTLVEAVKYFDDPDNALNYFAAKRWPNGVCCPYCDADRPMFLKTRRIWKCSKCRTQFSAKVGTVFEDSAIPLGKWLIVMWLVSNCKNGVSSYEIARDIGVTQKTAWFMLQRARKALQDERTGGKLAGEVEVDETFIGGKARFMHKHRKVARRRGRRKAPGPEGKAIVAAVLERGGRVLAQVVERRKKQNMHAFVNANVEPGAGLYSDDLRSYDGLEKQYAHQVIDHAVEYVRDNVHTNGLENFWSLLKRGINGTYVSVEPFHLFRYVDEQAFRFNNRKDTQGDAGRFALACSQAAGHRLTWKQVTGQPSSAQPAA